MAAPHFAFFGKPKLRIKVAPDCKHETPVIWNYKGLELCNSCFALALKKACATHPPPPMLHRDDAASVVNYDKLIDKLTE